MRDMAGSLRHLAVLGRARLDQASRHVAELSRASSRASDRPSSRASARPGWSRSRITSAVRIELHETGSPRFDRSSPRFERSSSRFERVSSRLDRYSPRLDRYSPRLDRVSPRPDRVSPRPARSSPHLGVPRSGRSAILDRDELDLDWPECDVSDTERPECDVTDAASRPECDVSSRGGSSGGMRSGGHQRLQRLPSSFEGEVAHEYCVVVDHVPTPVPPSAVSGLADMETLF